MLPCPFELESSKSRRKAVDNHLHDPRASIARFPGALGDFTIMLSCIDKSSGSFAICEIHTLYDEEGLVCFQCTFCRNTRYFP